MAQASHGPGIMMAGQSWPRYDGRLATNLKPQTLQYETLQLPAHSTHHSSATPHQTRARRPTSTQHPHTCTRVSSHSSMHALLPMRCDRTSDATDRSALAAAAGLGASTGTCGARTRTMS
eukprot:360597-Chlamydomonas_euryale.AAC.2